VILQNVTAIGRDHGLGLVVASRAFSCVDSTLQGGDAHSWPLFCLYPFRGAPAASVSAGEFAAGTFYFSNCNLRGGDVPLGSRCPVRAGDGIFSSQRTTVIVASGSGVIAGGQSSDFPTSSGGNGFHSDDGNSVLYVDGDPFRGGASRGGVAGVKVFNATPIPRLLASLGVTPGLAPIGTNATLSLLARPQEPHLVFLGFDLSILNLPSYPEPVLVFGGYFALFGTLVPDATGSATRMIPVPPDQNLIGQSVYFQSLGLNSNQLIVGPVPALTFR
jgi:hypothetical protein